MTDGIGVLKGFNKADKPLFWLPEATGTTQVVHDNAINTYYLRMRTAVLWALRLSEEAEKLRDGHASNIQFVGDGGSTTVFFGRTFDRSRKSNIIVRLNKGSSRRDDESGYLVWIHASLIPSRGVESLLRTLDRTKPFFDKKVWVGNL